MSDDAATNAARRKYPPLAENTYIGAFLVGVGYHAAQSNLPIPVSALVQQTGQDPSTGDLALDLDGRNYLFEFKRQGNYDGLAKEEGKSAHLWATLTDKHQAWLALGGEDEGKHLLQISRQCHVFSLAGIAWARQEPPPWAFQPYLERFPPAADHALLAGGASIPACVDLGKFIQNCLFPKPQNVSASPVGMQGANAAEFTDYIAFLRLAFKDSKGQLGGLVININNAGQVTPVIFENLADLTPENGMLLIASAAPPEPSGPKPGPKTRTI